MGNSKTRLNMGHRFYMASAENLQDMTAYQNRCRLGIRCTPLAPSSQLTYWVVFVHIDGILCQVQQTRKLRSKVKAEQLSQQRSLRFKATRPGRPPQHILFAFPVSVYQLALGVLLHENCRYEGYPTLIVRSAVQIARQRNAHIVQGIPRIL